VRLYPRIVFFLLASCVVPLVVLAISVVRAAHGWLDRTIVEVQVQSAGLLASTVSRELSDAERLLRLQLGNFRLREASPDAQSAFLYATFRLDPSFSVVCLQDGAGRDLVDPVYQAPREPELAPDHDVVSVSRLAAFRDRIPAPIGAGSVAHGKAYLVGDDGGAAIPVALASPWGDGIVLAVELRLSGVDGRLGAAAGADGEVALLGDDGTILASSGARGLVEPSSFSALVGTGSAEVRYSGADGGEVLAAMASVPGYPLTVVVASPAAVVEDAASDIQLRTGYIGGVALLAGLLMGTFLTRSITVPVGRLRDAAAAVGQGNLARRVELEGRDELAELGQAFNRMTASLQANDREIAAKNEEIEAFNRELVARVEQRTAQLREAQARLVQSGQLAAVAELSAGLAHELNNPLAGLLGMIQISIMREPEGSTTAELLRTAEREALRCKDIVANLLRFTARQGATGHRERVELDALLADVLGLLGPAFRTRGVTVEHRRSASPLVVTGDAGALGRAFGQLFSSVRTVAAGGATVTVTGASTSEGAGNVTIDIIVDRPTLASDDWRAASMGFWGARQILEEHAAALEEPPAARSPERGEAGEGTPGVRVAGEARWRLILPREARS